MCVVCVGEVHVCGVCVCGVCGVCVCGVCGVCVVCELKESVVTSGRFNMQPLPAQHAKLGLTKQTKLSNKIGMRFTFSNLYP